MRQRCGGPISAIGQKSKLHPASIAFLDLAWAGREFTEISYLLGILVSSKIFYTLICMCKTASSTIIVLGVGRCEAGWLQRSPLPSGMVLPLIVSEIIRAKLMRLGTCNIYLCFVHGFTSNAAATPNRDR